MANKFKILIPDLEAAKGVFPFFSSKVQAGFPSPASDYEDRKLDLHEYLIQNPAATFFLQVTGDSMVDGGLCDGDMVIVDRSLTPVNGKRVIATIDGDFTVKIFWKNKSGGITLKAENPEYPDLVISPHQELEIWGVVTGIVKKC